MGRDLFIFAMLSPAELKRPSKDPALIGSIPEEDDDELYIYRQCEIFYFSFYFHHFIDSVKKQQNHEV